MPKIVQKIKHIFTPEMYTAILVILTGVAGFGLGRLSALEQEKVPVTMLRAGSVSEGGEAAVIAAAEDYKNGVEEAIPTLQEGGKVVASKNATKYHLPWCSGAKRIAEANKVWFNSAEEARKAGYTPAANCKGIE